MSKPKDEPYRNHIEILQGTLDMLILQTLQWAPRHGYALSKAIRTNSGEILKVDTGSLYPALHRLERKGLLKCEWRESGSGPMAKYYSLTAAGRKYLQEETAQWQRYAGAVALVLES